MATKKELFGGDFLKIRSNIPTLKKNESQASFRKRVKMWTERTGLTYPGVSVGKSGGYYPTGIGVQSREIRTLLGQDDFKGSLNTTKDYSKDYNKELNEITQRQNRRITTNKRAQQKLDKVPKSGFSDLRGDNQIQEDQNFDLSSKVDSLKINQNKGPTVGDFTPTREEQTKSTINEIEMLMGGTDGETDSLDDVLEKSLTGTDGATSGARNSTMQDQLRETSGRLEQLKILQDAGVGNVAEQRNFKRGLIKTDKGFASVKSAQGNKALKNRLARLRAQRLAQIRIGG